MASGTMGSFQEIWLDLFNKAQDKFDRKEQRAFDRCEARKEANFIRLRNNKLISRVKSSKKERRRRLAALRRETKEARECPPPSEGNANSGSAMRKAALALSKKLRHSEIIAQKLFHSSRPNLASSVTTRDREQALTFAHDICNREESGTDLVFWTDASGVRYSNETYACAVVFKENGIWKLTTGVMPSTTINTAEFHAILLALETAVQKIEDIPRPRPDISVKVFSDSLASLHWIDESKQRKRHGWRQKQPRDWDMSESSAGI
ncbi:hypothetical protein PT974_00805 [Cladobotryum mycophilum]|uniref:RNase H type-1 domain-containing protein n=1 Tax=Cladobotryum mycophilum TaxID=491253 RepID=A0ABR0T1W8_9HYPO